VGELHGRPGAGFQLAFHGSLILAKDFHTAQGQLAVFEIQQEIDFPRFKGIASGLSEDEFANQAFEAIELEFAVFEIVCRGHDQVIGGMGAEL